MGKLIRLERLLREVRKRDSDAREEAFWRNSMVPMAIVMGVVIAVASVALYVGTEWGIFSDETMIWVLIAALVSVFALTKIVVANLIFYALANEQPRYRVTRGPRPTHRDRAPIPLPITADGGLSHPDDDRQEMVAAIAVNE